MSILINEYKNINNHSYLNIEAYPSNGPLETSSVKVLLKENKDGKGIYILIGKTTSRGMDILFDDSIRFFD